MLKEFDSATPLDKYMGNTEELKQVRQLVESFGEGVDKNSFLSPAGSFLIRKLSLKMLKKRKKSA